MNIEVGQIVAQIIAFLILLWVLKRFAWKPLLDLMEEREERIRSEFAAIEWQQKETDSLKRSYEEKLDQIEATAKKLSQEEVQKGRAIAKQIEQEAHQKGREIIGNAHIAAKDEIVKAKQELKEDIIKLTMKATEAVLKKDLDSNRQKELIAQYVAEADFK